MREYGTLHHRFWSSPTIRGLSDSAKLLTSYLIQGPQTNMIGCFRCPVGYISADLGWPQNKVAETVLELSANRIVTVSERYEYVFLPRFLSYNPPANSNVIIGMMKAALQIPVGSGLYGPFYSAFCEHIQPLAEQFADNMKPEKAADFRQSVERFGNRMETVRKLDQEQEQEQERKEPATGSSSDKLVAMPRGAS